MKKISNSKNENKDDIDLSRSSQPESPKKSVDINNINHNNVPKILDLNIPLPKHGLKVEIQTIQESSLNSSITSFSYYSEEKSRKYDLDSTKEYIIGFVTGLLLNGFGLLTICFLAKYKNSLKGCIHGCIISSCLLIILFHWLRSLSFEETHSLNVNHSTKLTLDNLKKPNNNLV